MRRKSRPLAKDASQVDEAANRPTHRMAEKLYGSLQCNIRAAAVQTSRRQTAGAAVAAAVVAARGCSSVANVETVFPAKTLRASGASSKPRLLQTGFHEEDQYRRCSRAVDPDAVALASSTKKQDELARS